MEANTITLIFKEKNKIVEANVDVDLTLTMSKVVETFLQLTHVTPSTSVKPLGIKNLSQVWKHAFIVGIIVVVVFIVIFGIFVIIIFIVEIVSIFVVFGVFGYRV
jgi:hypothetical protein